MWGAGNLDLLFELLYLKRDQLRKLLATFLLIGVGAFLFAQNQSQHYRIRTYSREQGLDQSQVREILQDNRGYLWMAMQGGGVSRFDGLRFKNYRSDDGLLGNDVGAMCLDKLGNLWFACDKRGLSCYNGSRFTALDKQQGFEFENSKVLFCGADNRLWLGTEGDGIFVWDGVKAQHISPANGLPSDSVMCFFQVDARTLWVGTSRGIYEIKDGKVNGLDSLRYPNAPRSVVETVIRRKNGRIVGSDARRGLWHLEASGFVYDSMPVNVGLINTLMEDNEQQLWIGGTQAVACIGPKGNRRFGPDDGLKEIGTNCIVQDANGNVWAGSEGGGATKFSREAFSLYGKGTPFAQRAVFAISEMGPDHLLIGTEVGLFELKNGRVYADSLFPIPDQNILAFGTDKQGLPLVASGRGTFRREQGKYHRIETAAANGRFAARNFANDPQGNVYGSTPKGIFTIEGDSARPFPIPQFTFGKENLNVYFGNAGTLYLTSDRNGLYRIKGGSVENFSTPAHLASDQVISFLEDRNGAAWIGTQDGLACVKGTQACYLNTHEGLAGNLIYILLQDSAGDIWVGTDFGLSRITIGPDSEPMSIRNYGSEDGFTGLECNQGAGFVDSRGRIWFGTIEGLACYHPDRDFFDPRPPHLEISGLQVKLEEVDWAKRNVATHPWTLIPVDPVLGSEENHIRIEFAGITQRLPEKVQYRYRLIGLDDAYSHPSTENYAVYPFLPPGEYTFEVIACNAEGVWTKDSVQFHFVIQAPFYRTVWFGLLAFALVMLSIIGFVRYRTATLQRQRSVLELKVKQRTEALEQANQVKGEFLAKMSHEIRTPMNGVIGMTDLLERTTLSPQQRKFVENIRVSGQNLLSLINDILDFSRIESGKMDLETIPFEVRHLIEEVMDMLAFSAFSKGLELVYWVDPEIRGPVMGDPARLKQILTNLLGNAIKFTSKGDIVVRATLVKVEGEKAEIQLSVKDSGIGIPKEKHATLFESFTQVDASTTRKYGGTGLGLAISNSLSKMMGGRMWLESDLGKGTTFFFTFLSGLSEPWKLAGEAHPAKALEGKKVVIAMQNEATIALISEYLRHWKMPFEVHSTLEAATDAVLDQPEVNFLLVDLRITHGDPNQLAKRIASTYTDGRVRFALIAEPDIAIILQNHVGLHGWVLSKPLKRGDLMLALMGKRAMIEIVDRGEQTTAFASQVPLRILVAEDNPINQDVANGMLSSLGYKVENALNGKEAVDMVMAGNIDLVFMDVQMPVMDGLEATRIIVHQLPKEKRPVIIAMTANAMESDRQRCLDAGMDTFISKPFMMGELVKILKSVPDMREGKPMVIAQAPEVKEEIEREVSSDSKANSPYKLTDMAMLDAVSGGEPAFVLGILNKLVVKLPEAVLELRQACSVEDWETLRATAHRTKSSAAYSGSEDLKEKFRELEHLAREREQLEQMPAKLDALSDYVDAIVAELRQHIAERS